MEQLLNCQSLLRVELERYITNFKKANKTVKSSKGYLERRLEGLNERWHKFEDNHNQIMEICTEGDKKERYFVDEVFNNVEEAYYATAGSLKDLLEDLKREKETRGINKEEEFEQRKGCSPSIGELRLPRITLTKFYGDYNSWTSFHDMFDSVINKNPSLSAVQKLHYLKTNLGGEAEQLLRHFQITDANFEPAWNMLVNRYQNKRALVNAQLKILLNQPNQVKESASGVKSLLDVSRECLEALQGLNINIKHWDPLLIHILTRKLSTETHTHWELTLSNRDSPTELPTLNEFTSFLESRFRILEALSTTTKLTLPSSKCHHFNRNPTHARSSIASKGSNCPVCSREHILRECPQFVNMNLEERREIVRKHLHCYNCILPGHSVKQCKSKTSCKVCKGRHHTFLHSFNDNTQRETSSRGQSNVVNRSDAVNVNTAIWENQGKRRQVLLATALVIAEGPYGDKTLLRALIDQGSEATFITQDATQRLRLRKFKACVRVYGIGQSGECTASKETELTIHSNSPRNFSVQVRALILPRLTGILPSQRVSEMNWTHLEGITLADPRYWEQANVDMILGADVFSEILLPGVRKGPRGSPIAQQTALGWILSGEVNKATNNIHVLHCTTDVDAVLKRFWEIEETGLDKTLTPAEKLCEHFFTKTTRRMEDGRYVVKLPFSTNDGKPDLGASREIAVRQLYQMERKFSTDPELFRLYSTFMKEYLELNHMRRVPTASDNLDKEVARNYLPHHAIKKDTSTTTKLRVVFDASRKTGNGKSLNDNLLVGPRLQDDLVLILLRWRQYNVVFTADIRQMYRQIRVHMDDVNYQSIVWREQPQLPISDYQLVTVTYGTASAPFLAIRTIRQLAEETRHKYPVGANIVFKNMYVDDVIAGCDTVSETLEAQNEIRSMLREGGFELRKWASNRREILEGIPEDAREMELPLQFNEDKLLKTLGVNWNATNDCFEYKVSTPDDPLATKRTVLSQIAKIFDPLGLLSPVVIVAKIFLQKLWLAGISWDEPLTGGILNEWQEYQKHLQELKSIRIPRWIGFRTHHEHIELHGFCDASLHAYAACVYTRVILPNGPPKIHLLTSKTRVAPIRKITLPRLELCGAVLLTKLIKQVFLAFTDEHFNTYAWTDSQIVLAWLKGDPNRWKPFVSNRVVEILQTVKPSQWQYVSSSENPADCASRGITPDKLKTHETWWTGPSWIKLHSSDWPALSHSFEATTLEERKVKSLHVTKTEMDLELLTKYSSLTKLLRITAYCQRFIHNLKTEKGNRRRGLLSVSERRQALSRWISLIQEIAFHNEILQLQNKRNLRSSSHILSLSPFVDECGLLRVGGRLKNSPLAFEKKHPILLPSQSILTTLIIRDAHQLSLHGSLQLTESLLRHKYWIINARRSIKKVLHRCTVCFRQAAASRSQLMGNLPMPRVTKTRVFSHTGVDFSGPVEIRSSRGRGRQQTLKGYIAIFVCLAVKAIHLEAVTDLSTSAFLAAMNRFIGRRGYPSVMYSDNGTNFVGAQRELHRQHQQYQEQLDPQLIQTLADKGIEWKFIPPSAPHFGGLWESGVKSMKYHLKRVINAKLTFEELTTVLVRIEACLNSRPLGPMSSDPNDCAALTPAHFLIGDALMTPPEPSILESNITTLGRWQLIQRIQQDFWKRWSCEYLSRLQQRPKWVKGERNIKLNELVLIKDERLPPSKWLLGRVTALHPGNDGLIRVVTVKCKDTILKRPVTKICPLPVEDND